MNDRFLVIYLLIVNICGFICMREDKKYAIKGKWRIPEKAFILMAFIGGTIGEIIGMHTFHHKTKKIKFKYGLPLILLMQIAVIIWIYTL